MDNKNKCHKCGAIIDSSRVLDLDFGRFVKEPRYVSTYCESLNVKIPLCINCYKNLSKVDRLAKAGKTVTLIIFIGVIGCFILTKEESFSFSFESIAPLLLQGGLMFLVAGAISLLSAIPFWGLSEIHRKELVSQYLKDNPIGQFLSYNGFCTGPTFDKAKNNPVSSENCNYLTLDEIKKVLCEKYRVEVEIFEAAKDKLKRKTY